MTHLEIHVVIGLLIGLVALGFAVALGLCLVADRLNAVLGDGNARYLFLRRRYRKVDKPRGYGG